MTKTEQKEYITINELSEFEILIPETPSDAEIKSAEILRKELENVYHLSLPIVRNSDKNVISIGNTKLWSIYFQDSNNNYKFDDEQSIITRYGNNVILNGNDKKGQFYAVCSFLENELSIHYLGNNVWTKDESLKLFKVKERIEKPAFENRSVFYSNALDPYYSSRNKINLWYDKTIAFKEIGGNDVGGPSGTHTYDQLVPKELHYYKNPEFYSDQNTKDRNINECTQLCLTNKEVFSISKKSIKEYLLKNKDCDFINIAPNDCKNTCTCKSCTSVNKEENSNFGTLARFLNQMSDDLRKDFPKLKLLTLSYLDLYKAPEKTKLKNNIYVRISTDTTSWYNPFRSIREDQNFKKRVSEWKNVSSNLWVYDYSCNFSDYLIIHPSINVLQDNLKYYSELGFKGVTIESFYENTGVEESELRAYIFSKLLFRPDTNVGALIDEFCLGYYGEIPAGIMKEYYSIIYEKKNLSSFNSESIKHLFNQADVQKIVTLLGRLDVLSLDENIKNRLARWELAIKYSLVKLYNNNLPQNTYLSYVDDIKACIEKNGYSRLGAFNNNIDEFIKVHSIRSRKRTAERNSKNKIFLDASDLIIYNPTADHAKYPSIVIDPSSTNGIAIKMPAKYQDWLVRYEPDKVFSENYDIAKFSIRVRAEGSDLNKQELAIGIGMLDRNTQDRQLDRFITLSELRSNYGIIELGSFKLTPSTVIYIFPIMNANLSAIYLDYFSFEKVK